MLFKSSNIFDRKKTVKEVATLLILDVDASMFIDEFLQINLVNEFVMIYPIDYYNFSVISLCIIPAFSVKLTL